MDTSYLILLGAIGLCLYPFVHWGIMWIQESETEEEPDEKKLPK